MLIFGLESSKEICIVLQGNLGSSLFPAESGGERTKTIRLVIKDTINSIKLGSNGIIHFN